MSRVLSLVAPAPSSVHVVDRSSLDDTGPTAFSAHVEQRYRRKGGGAAWWRTIAGRRWLINLEAPPLAEWSAQTVRELRAVLRAELKTRGARGAVRLSVTPDDHYPVPTAVTVVLRVGDLRASVWLNAGIVRNEMPATVLRGLMTIRSCRSAALTQALETIEERTTRHNGDS